MLEDRDYQEIAHMFKVIVESDIGPKLNKLSLIHISEPTRRS